MLISSSLAPWQLATPLEFNGLRLLQDSNPPPQHRLDAILLIQDLKSGQVLTSILIEQGSSGAPFLAFDLPAYLQSIVPGPGPNAVTLNTNSQRSYALDLKTYQVTLLAAPAAHDPPLTPVHNADLILLNAKKVAAHTNGVTYRQLLPENGAQFVAGGSWLGAWDSENGKLLWQAPIEVWDPKHALLTEQHASDMFQSLELGPDGRHLHITTYRMRQFEVDLQTRQVRQIKVKDPFEPELGPPPTLP